MGRRGLLGAGAAALGAAALGGLSRADNAYGQTAPLVLEAEHNQSTPLTIKGAAGQEANLTEWRGADGDLLSRVTKSGYFVSRHIEVDLTDRPNESPEIHYRAANGKWLNGIDWTATVPQRDFVVAAKMDHPNFGQVADLIYCAHRGPGNAPTVGVGITEPYIGGGYRLTVMSEVNEPGMGGLMVRAPRASTGKPFAIRQDWSSNLDFFSILADGSLEMRNTAGSLVFGVSKDGLVQGPFKVQSTSGGRVDQLHRPDGTVQFESRFGSSNELTFYANNGGSLSPVWQVNPADRRLRALGGLVVPHTGSSSPPSGGVSGEIRVGNNALWVNDRGNWKSIRL